MTSAPIDQAPLDGHRLVPSPKLGLGILAALGALTVALVLASLLVSVTPAVGQLADRASDRLGLARDGIGADDGRIGWGSLSAFDTDEPAVARLDPRLRTAVQEASRAAAADGVELRINSGWRSRAYQQQLLDDAVEEYGSLTAARRWVNTPAASTHVTGEAVDVGPHEAAAWLDAHGSAYGLCRVYANEAWHFERLTSPGGSCPALRADARG